MIDLPSDEVMTPLIEERLRTEVHEVSKGEVNVHLRTLVRQEIARETLIAETIDIERVAVGRFVDETPQVRQEGEVTIVPVLEEVIVKRLYLREEVRLTRRRVRTDFEEAVDLRRQEATIDRTVLGHSPTEDSEEHSHG